MSKNRTERWNRKLRVALVLTLSLLAIHLTRTQSRSQGTLKHPPPLYGRGSDRRVSVLLQGQVSVSGTKSPPDLNPGGNSMISSESRGLPFHCRSCDRRR